MHNGKLLAEWFWIDRWVGSDLRYLPIETRGLYREMLTQSLRLGGTLPNDPAQIRTLVDATPAEWRRAWPAVEKFWRVDGDRLVPLDDFAYTRPLPKSRGPVPHRPWIPAWLRRAVLAKYGQICVRCGSTDALELDHVIPFVRGGPSTVDNMQPLCRPCNRAKGARCA